MSHEFWQGVIIGALGALALVGLGQAVWQAWRAAVLAQAKRLLARRRHDGEA